MAAMTAAQVMAQRPLSTFETSEAVAGIKTSGATAARVWDAAKGRYGLEVRFAPLDGGQIEIPVPEGDWRGYGSLVLDVTNTSSEPLLFFDLSVEVRDQAGAGTVGRNQWELAPGEKVTFAQSLNAPPSWKLVMQSEPPIDHFAMLESDHQPVDLGKIATVRISMSKLASPRTIVIDNLRLGPAPSYEKIVDRFGQYTGADWPGKVKSEAVLKAQLVEEQAELKAAPALPDRDEYGGLADGPQLEATGYFRTVKRDGKWWFVTPSGHLFFLLGMGTVDTRGETLVEGREQMFEWLPAKDDPLAAHYSTLTWSAPGPGGTPPAERRVYNFYSANLERKYGKDWYGQWQQATLARLKSWGFNSLGWSDTQLTDHEKMPYTLILDISGDFEKLKNMSPLPNYGTGVPDTFDPRFPEAVDRSLRAIATERRNDPWLVGYFVSNELPWGFMRSDRTRYALALKVLSLGAASPAKNALVKQLQARYGSIEKLNAAWNSRLASWEELLEKPYRYEGDLSTAACEDMGAFVKELAMRYFRTIHDTLKKYDPNHLYLGVRFAWLIWEKYQWTTPEVEEAAAAYCDVISYNVYVARVDGRWDFLKQLDKPAIIGEFNFGVPDRGIYPEMLGVRSQEERARMYQEYVRSVADHPDFVGCYFFEYLDEPPTGRGGDYENIVSGFVSVTDSAYPDMVEAARTVNAEAYRRRETNLQSGPGVWEH